MADSAAAFVSGGAGNSHAVIDNPLTGTPYGTALCVCIGLAVLCWVVAIVTSDRSWPMACFAIAAMQGAGPTGSAQLGSVTHYLWSASPTNRFASPGTSAYDACSRNMRNLRPTHRFEPMGCMIVQQMAIDHPERMLSMTPIMSTTGERGYFEATPETMAALTAPSPIIIDAIISHTAHAGSRP